MCVCVYVCVHVNIQMFLRVINPKCVDVSSPQNINTPVPDSSEVALSHGSCNRVVKMHRMHYLYRSFSAKEACS